MDKKHLECHRGIQVLKWKIIMSGLSFPNDELNQADSSSLDRDNEKPSLLHPIDEADDFYDPFSDLSLFLSRKIKGEINESGSLLKWSGKIESNLLAKILPEFRKKFPNYRLGASALKKVWEKVGYYYEKIQGQKEALENNGKLNLKYMIRENLKKSLPSEHLPPYTIAKQIATKLSECIATLEGTRPEIDQLTKVIWSVQKHLLRDLSLLQTKSPYDEYDKVDKLIVKTQLEIIAKGENLDPYMLKQEIFKKLKAYFEIKTLAKENQLTSTLSMILAEKLQYSSLIACHFSLKEQKTIESFIRQQIEMGKCNSLLTSDEHRLELIQRILALYTIAEGLPKNMSEESVRASIRHVKQCAQDKTGIISPNMDQVLFVFINAEMHLMDEEKILDSSAEDAIVEAYWKGISLPLLSSSQIEQFELLIWKTIEEEGNLLSYTSPDALPILEQELGNVLIDNPKQSFKMIISSALQFFKKVIATPYKEDTVKEKVDTWVAQNDMLIRTIHFNPNSPLLALIEKKWKTLHLDELTVDHERFIQDVMEDSLKLYPLLSSFEEELKGRLWILYKYHWYHVLTDGQASTYERFLLWHKTLLKRHHPEWTKERLNSSLSKLSNQLIPLAPFERAE